MFDTSIDPDLSTHPQPHEVTRKIALEKLEAQRVQNSAEYASYYDALKTDAQSSMCQVMKGAAIDCQIFSGVNNLKCH